MSQHEVSSCPRALCLTNLGPKLLKAMLQCCRRGLTGGLAPVQQHAAGTPCAP